MIVREWGHSLPVANDDMPEDVYLVRSIWGACDGLRATVPDAVLVKTCSRIVESKLPDDCGRVRVALALITYTSTAQDEAEVAP